MSKKPKRFHLSSGPGGAEGVKGGDGQQKLFAWGFGPDRGTAGKNQYRETCCLTVKYVDRYVSDIS